MGTTRNKQEKLTPVQATFKGLTEFSLLSNAVLLVSVGNPYHEQNHLKASLNLLNDFHKKHKDFKSITVLVAGTLQRHNFWTFTKKLSNEELSKLVRPLPADVSLQQFCNNLASKFFPLAEKAEDEYLDTNKETYYFTLHGIIPKMLKWNEVIPMDLKNEAKAVDDVVVLSPLNIPEDKEESPAFKDFGYYFQLIQANYSHNVKFQKAVDRTINEFIKNKKDEIKAEAARIVILNPKLQEFFNNPFELAKICCRNYLFEEAALLIPMNYKSILYPGEISEALKETKEMWSSKTAWIHIRQKNVKNNKKHDFLGLSDTEAQTQTKTIFRMSSAGNIFSSLNITPPVGSTPVQASPIQASLSDGSIGKHLNRGPIVNIPLNTPVSKGSVSDSPQSSFSDASFSSLESGTSSPSITQCAPIAPASPTFSLMTSIPDNERMSDVNPDGELHIRLI